MADRWIAHRLRRAATVAGLEQATFRELLALARRWGEVVRRAVLPGGGLVDPTGVYAGAQIWRAGLERVGDDAIVPALGRASAERFGATRVDAGYVARHRGEAIERLTRLPEEVLIDVRRRLAERSPDGAVVPGVIADLSATVLNPESQGWRDRLGAVARTETVGAFNAGAVDTFRQLAAVQGLDVRQVWLSTGDDRTRHTHQVADGQMVDLGERFEVGGFSAAYPADPFLPPQERINCRCTLLIVDS
jgi:hypothetical protein